MNDIKYYLFYRIDDGEWKSIFHRSFLINKSMDKIYGQFVSSLWFNLPLDGVSYVELMVARRPPVNLSMRSIIMRSICEDIRTCDTVPEFVVAHDRFNVSEIKRELSGKMLVSELRQISHQAQGKQMSATIQGTYITDDEIHCSLVCPAFVISL